MAIEIPSYLEPVFDFYGIPWPDIDENAFHELKSPLREFGADLDEVGNAIDSALKVLAAANQSHTLRALETYFDHVRSEFLEPIKRVCDDLAGPPCDVAYDAVVALKLSLIATLLDEVGNDIYDIIASIATGGLASPAAAAEMVLVRELIHEMIQAAEGELVTRLLSLATGCIDGFVNSLVNPFIGRVANSLENAIDSYDPQMLRSAYTELDGAASDRLHVSPADLDHGIDAIVASSAHLDRATTKLTSTVEEVFARPAPGASVSGVSSALRFAVKSAIHTVEQDLANAVRQLIDHVVKHFVALVRDYQRAIDELDQHARQAASVPQHGRKSSVVVMSAGGTGAAAAAVATRATGTIDREQVDSVHVGESSAVESAASLSPAGHAGPAGARGSATTTDRTELLGTRSSAGRPRVGEAEPVASPGGVAGARRDGHAGVGRRAAADAEAAHGVKHLDAKESEKPKTKLDRAHKTDHEVEALQTRRVAGRPITDSSPEDDNGKSARD